MEAALHARPDQTAVVGSGLACAWALGAKSSELALGEVFANRKGPIRILRNGEGAVERVVRPIRPAGTRVGGRAREGAEVRVAVVVVALVVTALVVAAAVALIGERRSRRDK